MKILYLFVLFLVFSSFVSAKSKRTSKKGLPVVASENLSQKYRSYFIGKLNSSKGSTYTDPNITLESRGKTQWFDKIELLKVINYPPPPVDPVPYELWVMVNGKKVYPTGQACSVYKELNAQILTQEEAIKMAHTLAYLHAIKTYVQIDIMDAQTSIVETGKQWKVNLLLVLRPANNGVLNIEPQMKRIEIQIGNGDCRIS